jgi:transcriptional regulator with XRE-family HTH domain
MADNTSSFLAANIRSLREARGLTQQHLSTRSGVPRPTWANLESGSANPTLSVLVRAASALNVSIEELIGPPRAIGRFYRADQLPVRQRSGVSVGKVLPDALSGIDVERMVFPRGGRMGGVPHTPGSREYLFCESGKVELSASGSSWQLEPGDVVVFRGDQRHSYRNLGKAESVAFSVVLLPPPGD